VSVARDFDDIERDLGGEAVREALNNARYVGPMADVPPYGDDAPERPKLAALPFVYRDPATIKRREWLYGFELRRRQVSAIIAPGAAGKTTFQVGRAICMATGKSFFGHRSWEGPLNVWLWNLEDEQEEVEKIVHAFLKLWNIHPDDLDGRLFLNGADSAGASSFKIAVESDFGGFKIQRPVVEALTEELRAKKIDYLGVDPFVSSHAVDENKNQAIDAVAKEWLSVAREADCAISLAHHLRKTSSVEFTAQDARGAGAMINAARSCLIFQRMSAEEAKTLQVPACDRKSYFKVYDDKNNKAPPAAKAEWYQFQSIGLGNAGVGSDGPEDQIGALQRWNAPDLFAGVTARQLLNIQEAINNDPDNCRKHSASNRWVGKKIAWVLDMNIDNEGDVERIKEMLKAWLDTGALRTVERQTEKREMAPFVEVGSWATVTE
jgi:hypothetical protein